ncbi:MAG: protein phosphatase 2C domain-containing protein [Candidatus Rokuibacteriota bacterium]
MIDLYGLSDPGRKRKDNEDALLAVAGLGLGAVADGMGGHQSGEVASALAVEALSDFVARAHQDRDLTWPFGLDPACSFEANCLRTGIKLANRQVIGASRGRPELAGMGTTVVAVLARDGRLTYASVGDSRAYLVRGRGLRQLTRDDSWVEAALAQRLIADEERHAHPFRHVLTKAVGLQDDLDLDVFEQPLEPGDRVLLCSDGLTTALPDKEIGDVVEMYEGDLEGACRALVAAANEAGGPDNITVVLLLHHGGSR